ncbi:MAG: hypothetical protein QJR06_09970 [Alicyclobacillaceae bacterium]|nr:hypothetical protein [Alicyclobacillaceae bacterium]
MMVNEPSREQIKRVVEDCEIYWLLKEIPRAQVEDMKTELERHLLDAAADGKPVEKVIGKDVHAFADSWARAVQPGKPLIKILEHWAYLFLTSAMVILPVKHIYNKSATIPIFLWDPVLIALLAAAVHLGLSPHLLAPGKTRTTKKWIVTGSFWACVLAMLAITTVMALRKEYERPLFLWPWYASVGLAVVTWLFSQWRIRRDVTAPLDSPEEKRRKARRTMGSFALLTLFLAALTWIWLHSAGTVQTVVGIFLGIVGLLWWTTFVTWK